MERILHLYTCHVDSIVNSIYLAPLTHLSIHQSFCFLKHFKFVYISAFLSEYLSVQIDQSPAGLSLEVSGLEASLCCRAVELTMAAGSLNSPGALRMEEGFGDGDQRGGKGGGKVP